LLLTVITVRQRPGQGEPLERRLAEIRQGNLHHLRGTAARYVMRNQGVPDELVIVLAWRFCMVPPEEERGAALVALRADLADVLDWETAVIQEGETLLHA